MKTHQKGNTIERSLSFIFIGFLTCGDFAQNQDREHMSSAQIDVAKRKLDTHDNHRKKHHTWTHIEKTHEHTTKGKHIQKAWKHTKRETPLKEFCLSFSFGFLTCGDFAQNQDREHMSSAQIDVAKRKLDTHDNHRKKHHTCTHIEKTHEHTTKGEHIQKAWKHTKRETQLKEFCLSFSLVFLHVGISRETKIESTCHLHK